MLGEPGGEPFDPEMQMAIGADNPVNEPEPNITRETDSVATAASAELPESAEMQRLRESITEKFDLLQRGGVPFLGDQAVRYFDSHGLDFPTVGQMMLSSTEDMNVVRDVVEDILADKSCSQRTFEQLDEALEVFSRPVTEAELGPIARSYTDTQTHATGIELSNAIAHDLIQRRNLVIWHTQWDTMKS